MESLILPLLGLTTFAYALPQPQTNGAGMGNASIPGNVTYVLPMFDPNPSARAAEISRNQAGYLYGPSLIGNSSFFLTGPLGDQLVQSEIALWNQTAAPARAAVQADARPVLATLTAVSHHYASTTNSLDANAFLEWWH